MALRQRYLAPNSLRNFLTRNLKFREIGFLLEANHLVNPPDRTHRNFLLRFLLKWPNWMSFWKTLDSFSTIRRDNNESISRVSMRFRVETLDWSLTALLGVNACYLLLVDSGRRRFDKSQRDSTRFNEIQRESYTDHCCSLSNAAYCSYHSASAAFNAKNSAKLAGAADAIGFSWPSKHCNCEALATTHSTRIGRSN